MCFSPAASFAAAASLGVIGGATVEKTRRWSHVPFASIPLLFSVQQLAEGVIWLSLARPTLLLAAQYVYLFFSHVFWPAMVPVSVYLLEPDARRRRLLTPFILLGVVVSAYFLYFLAVETVRVDVLRGSIAYVAPHFSTTFVLSPYALAVCGSCVLSSRRLVAVFGIAVFLSAFVASWLYYETFVSVWCYFSAILSVIVYLEFRGSRPAKQV